jgi:hypothetical protein
MGPFYLDCSGRRATALGYGQTPRRISSSPSRAAASFTTTRSCATSTRRWRTTSSPPAFWRSAGRNRLGPIRLAAARERPLRCRAPGRVLPRCCRVTRTPRAVRPVATITASPARSWTAPRGARPPAPPCHRGAQRLRSYVLEFRPAPWRAGTGTRGSCRRVRPNWPRTDENQRPGFVYDAPARLVAQVRQPLHRRRARKRVGHAPSAPGSHGADAPDAHRITTLKPHAAPAATWYVYFDNDYEANAPNDALRLIERLRGRADYAARRRGPRQSTSQPSTNQQIAKRVRRINYCMIEKVAQKVVGSSGRSCMHVLPNTPMCAYVYYLCYSQIASKAQLVIGLEYASRFCSTLLRRRRDVVRAEGRLPTERLLASAPAIRQSACDTVKSHHCCASDQVSSALVRCVSSHVSCH